MDKARLHVRINIPQKVRPDFVHIASRASHTSIACRTLLDNTVPGIERKFASAKGEFEINLGITWDGVAGVCAVDGLGAGYVGVDLCDITHGDGNVRV